MISERIRIGYDLSPEALKDWFVSVSGLIARNKEFLLVKQGHKKGHRLSGFWRLPTGRLEYGLDPYDECKREILEETGIETRLDENPLDVRVLASHDPLSRNKGIKIIYYRGSPAFNTDEPKPCTNCDVDDAKYFYITDLHKKLGPLSANDLTDKVFEEISRIRKS